jgi:hypothetical protein
LKKTKIIAIVCTLVVLLGVLSSCGGKTDPEVYGEWTDSSGSIIYNFKEDGTLDLKAAASGLESPVINGTFSTSGKNITIELEIDGAKQRGRSEYLIENGTMTITDPDGTAMVLTKNGTAADDSQDTADAQDTENAA